MTVRKKLVWGGVWFCMLLMTYKCHYCVVCDFVLHQGRSFPPNLWYPTHSTPPHACPVRSRDQQPAADESDPCRQPAKLLIPEIAQKICSPSPSPTHITKWESLLDNRTCCHSTIYPPKLIHHARIHFATLIACFDLIWQALTILSPVSQSRSSCVFYFIF